MNTKARNIQNNISFVVNSKGKRTAMMINLKDKAMQQWAEDIQDLLIIKERMEDPDLEFVDFFEVTKDILAKREKSHV